MPDAPTKPIVNLADVPLKDSGNGDKFAAKIGRLGPSVASTGLGCTLTVVPAGKRAWPFHRHHVIHEMFYILSGTGEYRLGKKTHSIRAGDLIGAPAGGEAHQIVNTGTDELRYLAFSDIPEVDIVEYPDGDTFAAAAGIKNADFKTATFRYMGRNATIDPADYWK
jgi:uncharacterized cupin superfamily protein